MVHSFLRLKKNLTFFFAIYIYIYIYIYFYIYLYIYINLDIYIYIYILKKRTRVGHVFFSKERNVLHSFAFFCKRMLRSSRSFTFFVKERCILCVLLRSLQKNVAFFAFFYVLCKRTLRSLRSLRSFTFLRKEHKRMYRSFGFHNSPKTLKRMQKNVACFKRTQNNDAFRT